MSEQYLERRRVQDNEHDKLFEELRDLNKAVGESNIQLAIVAEQMKAINGRTARSEVTLLQHERMIQGNSVKIAKIWMVLIVISGGLSLAVAILNIPGLLK